MLTKSTIRLQAIDDLVETLFEIEGTLKKSDTLIIVVNDEPNDSMIARLRHLYDERGIYIAMHNINRLQQNILKHTLVPEHKVVSTIKYPNDNGVEVSDLELLMTKYKLKNLSQLPEISRFDPVALLIMLRPGQVCEINRKSATSVSTLYYRVCV
jgi:DNA-directed RNA polymerase subunit H (RpoH/RPB5)